MSDPITTLLPTAYFPPVSWFIHLLRSEYVFIEQMETFHKQTYRNRCEIMTASGKSSLVVPVVKPHGNHTMTQDVEICYREPWQQQHWKAILSAYSSSPYFSYYADLIQPLFEKKETLLISHNHQVMELIFRLAGIDPVIGYTEDYLKNPLKLIDLRLEITPKKQNILMNFPVYSQVFSHRHGFMADLSILDLLFNLGPDARKYLEEALNS
jgi:hypothetical protein